MNAGEASGGGTRGACASGGACSAAGEDTPIMVLRRVAQVVQMYAPVTDARYFVRAVRRYEVGAARGLTLDEALGLAARQSERGWWTVEARQLRDVTIRALRVTRFATLSTKAAARAIAALALRQPELFRDYPAPRSWRQIARILARR